MNGTLGSGAILFTQGGRIYRVPTAGGRSTIEVEPNTSSGKSRWAGPGFARRPPLSISCGCRIDDGRLMLAEPGKPPVTVLSADVERAVGRSGLRRLRQRRNTPGTTRGSGERPCSGRALRHRRFGWQHLRGSSLAAFSVSRTGALVYQAHADMAELVWFDHSGRELAPVGPQGDYLTMRISPDRTASVRRARGIHERAAMVLWVLDFERPDAETRLTSEPRSEMGGVWMPDGMGAFFSAETRGGPLQDLLDLGITLGLSN